MGCGTHGLDRLGVEARFAPGMAGGLQGSFVVRIRPVGPVVASQVVPQVLHGIELRGIRRQLDQADVGWNLQRLGRVKAGLIPDEHGVHARSKLLGELGEELVDDVGIEVGSEQSNALSALRTDAREHVEIIVLRLAHRSWSLASPAPYAGQRALLTEARFVLEPDLHPLQRMSRADALDPSCDVFLKASWACGSAF